MPRLCSSRTIFTATSLLLAQPTMAQKPGMRPSTSWMPQARSWMSSIGPFSFILSPWSTRSPESKRSLFSASAELHDLGLDATREAYAFDDLLGEQRGDPRIERLAEVGEPHRLGGDGVEQAARTLEHRGQVAERLDLHAGEGVDHRQVVGRVREDDRRVGTELADGGLHLGASPRRRCGRPRGWRGSRWSVTSGLPAVAVIASVVVAVIVAVVVRVVAERVGGAAHGLDCVVLGEVGADGLEVQASRRCRRTARGRRRAA